MLQLDLKSAAYTTAGAPVLQEFSLELKSGEFIALLGANGCGKTTLLKCLAGLHTQMSGTCQLDGSELAEWSLPERAQRLSYLPQSVTPAFSFLAAEVIRLARYHVDQDETPAEQEKRLQEVARLMEVDDLLQRHVDELSGGEWQRVAIARTMMQDAEFVLLDEPTAHLDLAHRLSLFQHCRHMARTGKGILCATHDLDAALEYADRIVVLREGRVAADGRPDEVMTSDMMKKVFGAAPVEIRQNPLSLRPQIVLKSKKEQG